jgi:CheY-like chemotaxis protein
MPQALVVEDDPMSVEVIDRLLQKEGLSVTAVHDPARLDSIVDQLHTFDVIFLDLELPTMDGYELLAVLLDEFKVQVPIVAYTMHTNEIQTARQQGFHSFLGKPLKLARFPDQLRRIMDDEPVWETL